jgi:SAM-dependent methyltransferase
MVLVHPPPDLPFSPAAERNAAPILAELERLLPAKGVALELASGTGQHAAYFAAALRGWQWLPTETEALALPAIATRCRGLPNVSAPLLLDVTTNPWEDVPTEVDAVYAANLLHIAPWAVSSALMRGSARHLRPGGLLLLYGPFLIEGLPTAASNLAFDADLKRRNRSWGLRPLGAVLEEARHAGLRLRERLQLPANNLLLVLERESPAATDP